MKKLILALTALSLAGLFTACQSAKEETVEDRLRDEYGWKGTVLPKAAPDPQSVITESEEPKTEPKDAGIVSTVDLKDTLPENPEEQVPVPPENLKKTTPSDGKKPSVKCPSNVKYELTGETKTHIVKKGETLSSIAQKEYQNGHLWGILFRANRELLKGNANLIRPGMKITVPGIRKVLPAKQAEPAKVTYQKKAVPESPKAAEPKEKAAPETASAKKEAAAPAPSAAVLPAPVEKAPEPPRTN